MASQHRIEFHSAFFSRICSIALAYPLNLADRTARCGSNSTSSIHFVQLPSFIEALRSCRVSWRNLLRSFVKWLKASHGNKFTFEEEKKYRLIDWFITFIACDVCECAVGAIRAGASQRNKKHYFTVEASKPLEKERTKERDGDSQSSKHAANKGTVYLRQP